MQELRDLAASEAIRGFVVDPPRRLEESVQGVNLFIDAYWLRTFRANFSYRTEEPVARDSFRLRRQIENFRIDFQWRPAGWADHCVARGYPPDAAPVVVQVLLRETADPKVLVEAPRQVAGHPIVYEYRPPCIAFGRNVTPGALVGRAHLKSDESLDGTLGGFLRDTSSGATYALSCAHVLGGPGSKVYLSPGTRAAGVPVAEVRFASMPPISQPSAKCNRLAGNTILDVAIAELLPGIVAEGSIFGAAGPVDHMTPIAGMTSDDPVTFRGAGSRRVISAKTGALNIWREIEIQGSAHCMGDMFVIEPPTYQYVRTSLSKHGDSGAWILSHENGLLAWDGVLVAGDGAQVYCLFSENVLNICRSHNPRLILS